MGLYRQWTWTAGEPSEILLRMRVWDLCLFREIECTCISESCWTTNRQLLALCSLLAAHRALFLRHRSSLPGVPNSQHAILLMVRSNVFLSLIERTNLCG